MKPLDAAIITEFEGRIHDLCVFRQWYRTYGRSMRHALRDIEAEHTLELRALLRIRSVARRAERAAFRVELARTAAQDQAVATFTESQALDFFDQRFERRQNDAHWRNA